MSKPTVPEVSLIFDDAKLSTLKNEQPKSYKEWKQQQQKQQSPQQPLTQLMPNQTTSTADRKKIVTFDLPIEAHPDKKLLPPPTEQSTPMSNICEQLDLSLCDPKKNITNARHSMPVNFMADRQNRQQDYNDYVKHYHNDRRMQMPTNASPPDAYKHTQMQQPPKHTNFDENAVPPKDITLSEIYRLLQNMQGNNQATANNRTYEPNQLNVQDYGMQTHQQPINQMPIVAGNFNASSNPSYLTNGEPTMRDMFNVILRQQEQLSNVQNQVHMLLLRSNQPPFNQLDSQPHFNRPNFHANSNINGIEDKKHVGVMTSFEINVQNYNANAIRANDRSNKPEINQIMARNQQLKQCGCACNCGAGKKPQTSESSDSNDDNFDTSPNESDSQTGWTFYGNILDHVNDVLQSTPPGANTKQNENVSPNIGAANIENRYDCTNDNAAPRQNIRATQFKQVGIQIDDVNISGVSKR